MILDGNIRIKISPVTEILSGALFSSVSNQLIEQQQQSWGGVGVKKSKGREAGKTEGVFAVVTNKITLISSPYEYILICIAHLGLASYSWDQ